MSLDGKIKELAQILRTEGGRVELDQFVFHPTGGGAIPVAWPAAVEVFGGEFRLDLRIPSGAQLPAALAPLLELGHDGPRLVTSADCYRITARTADGVAVTLERVLPKPHHTNTTTHYRRCRVGFTRLALPAEGIDAMDSAEIRAMLDALPAPTAPAPAATPAAEPAAHVPEEDLFALIPQVHLRIRNNGTDTTVRHPFLGELRSSKSNCFVGQVDGGTFCLHEDEAGDLAVYYRRAIDCRSARHATTQVFDGILAAVGYTHGCHPWPFYREHRRHHRVVERWLKAPDECQRHGLLPMQDGHLAHSPEARRLFIAVADFFAAASEEALAYKRALWLMHETCPRHLAFEVRILTLCSLLEGVIHRLEARLLTNDERARHDAGGLTRPQKWLRILDLLGLPWADAFERVYRSWDDYRHPLAHGFHERVADDSGPAFNAYSRLTAALHVLLAREAGYAGPIAKSILEGGEMVVIPAPRP
jgi:hypothetical protein